MQRCLGIALALLLAALPAGGAHAHAVLLESSPAADAVLLQAPERVVLRFNEPVRPAVIRLLRASDETSIELGIPEVTDTTLHLPLPPDLAGGSYLLNYRVTSADGHPVVGSFVFAIGAPDVPTAPAPHAAEHSEDLWPAAGVAARTLWYGSLLLAAGLALFLGLLPVPTDLQPPLRRALAWLAVLGLAACFSILGATGGALHGGPFGALLTPAPWRIALATPVAASVGLAVPGLVVMLVAARWAIRRRRWAFVAGALLVAASFAASGHAATAGPGWITRPALVLHALCAAFWVGAFLPLFMALRRLPRLQVLTLLRRFSTGAILAVAGLVLAGVVLSALQLRTPSALIATDYGRLLLLKVGLVVLLLGVGALNRLILTPALQQPGRAMTPLRRTIGVDLGLAAGVVALTAGLGTVPPPRALAEQAGAHAQEAPEAHAPEAPPGQATHGDSGHGNSDQRADASPLQIASQGEHHLVLVATPATVGENRIDLYLMDHHGQPVDAGEAELAFALPALAVEALRVDAMADGPGHFRGRANLPLAGDWHVSADLLVDDFTKLPFQVRIVVAR